MLQHFTAAVHAATAFFFLSLDGFDAMKGPTCLTSALTDGRRAIEIVERSYQCRWIDSLNCETVKVQS